MKIAVIGAGAAGLLVAGFAAQNGAEVVLFEKNKKVGRKIAITGKGRCNITNNCTPEEFMQNVPVNNRFLYSAINNFTPTDTIEFFEALGLETKTERGNRVFPLSDKATDVVDVLFKFVRKNGVEIVWNEVADVVKINDDFCVTTADEIEYAFDKVVICTGGASYPLTGSTGDGYKFAESFGHNIVTPSPSLVPIECDGNICPRMQGLALKNVRITVFENEKEIYSDFGEMLFTHFGVSGPLILSASAHIRNLGKKKYKILIDLKPALDEKTLDNRLLSDFSKSLNKDFANALGALLPRKMIPIVIEKSKISKDIKVNSITREMRAELLSVLKGFELIPTKFRPIDEAIITTGGIAIKEVSPKNMQSKLVDGLYFAGEILDVDAYTGGFNLQIAWSTAKAVADNIFE